MAIGSTESMKGKLNKDSLMELENGKERIERLKGNGMKENSIFLPKSMIKMDRLDIKLKMEKLMGNGSDTGKVVGVGNVSSKMDKNMEDLDAINLMT